MGYEVLRLNAEDTVVPFAVAHVAVDHFVRGRAAYVLLNPLRLFDTVNDPSCCATILIQYAGTWGGA